MWRKKKTQELKTIGHEPKKMNEWIEWIEKESTINDDDDDDGINDTMKMATFFSRYMTAKKKEGKEIFFTCSGYCLWVHWFFHSIQIYKPMEWYGKYTHTHKTHRHA